MSEELRPWHRLFGLSWQDFFWGTDVKVEEEKDLSVRQQFLDLVLIREDNAPPPHQPPDGFEDLERFTLVTFKSYREALLPWSLHELMSHYCNFRKQAGASMHTKDMPGEEEFCLIAVCVRSPDGLAGRVTLRPVSPGVYEADALGLRMRVVVIHELPLRPHNAMMLMFSADEKKCKYGAKHFQQHSSEVSSLLSRFVRQYHEEGLDMPETLQEFNNRMRREVLQEATYEERLEGVPPEQLAARLTPEQRLEGLPPEQRLEGLSPEQRLKGLTPKDLEELKRRLNAQESPDDAK